MAEQQGQSAQEQQCAKFRVEDDLTRVLSLGDPDRHKLTKEEHEWAEDIKDNIESLPDLDNLSDFMYAQLAMICKEDVTDAVNRCYAMQEFKHEYKILDTFQHGRRYIDFIFRTFPRQCLAFGFNEKEGTSLFAHDFAKFDPKKFTSPDMAEDWMIGMYYSHTLFFPDLESVRRGIITVVECEGMTMRSDVLKHYQAFFSEFLCHYPMNGKCKHYHTGALINVLSSILRKLHPEELRDNYQVGLQFDGHMGDVFMVPTVDEAVKRNKARMEEALRQRYENEKTFTL